MTKQLPLSRGQFALVDDADYDWLSQWTWYIVGPGYAGRFDRSGGTPKLIYLHRFILGAKSGQRVDHINGDKLDARRANLRIVTRSQNQQNRKVSSNNTSGVKGVCWNASAGKWHVRISVDGRRVHLGYYKDLETAALLYDAAARHFYGDYARPNQPETPTSPKIAGLLAHVLAMRAVSRPQVREQCACHGLCALCRQRKA